MAYYIHFKDPNSEEIVHFLSSIPKCPGTCFFMDINRSTDMKYEGGLTDWGRKLNNTFNFLSLLNDFPEYIVKGIGDEIMLFIPDDVLKSKTAINSYYMLLEEIYATLYNIRHYPVEDTFLACKVAIHYCIEVYNITFFEGTNDYYGSDVDLTARLMTKCLENRIVLSEKFLNKVHKDLKFMGLPENAGCMAHISGRFKENFKGVPVSKRYRIIDVE
jgi:class 3 adenylate cyclase